MTQINKIDVGPDGTLYIRFLKDGGGWHRTSIPLNTDPDIQIVAVNKHLEAMGHEPIIIAERTLIRVKHQEEKARPRVIQKEI